MRLRRGRPVAPARPPAAVYTPSLQTSYEDPSVVSTHLTNTDRRIHWRQPPGDAGDTPNFLVGRDVNGNRPIPQYYYVLSDIAEQYWLSSVRSASSRFHAAIRRHKFASVRQADSRLTRLVPTNLELALTPLRIVPIEPSSVAVLAHAGCH